MNRLTLTSLYQWGIYGVLFLIVLHAPLSVFFAVLFPEASLVAKAWKEITLAGLAVIALVLVTKWRLWNRLIRDKLIWLAALFIDLHLLLALILGGDLLNVIAGLVIDLRFIGMFLLTYILVLLRPDALRGIIRAVMIGAGVVIGFGLLQITVLPDDILRGLGYSRETITPFTTIDQNPDFVRINSTLRGPNPLGALMVVYAGLIVAYIVRHRLVLRAKQLAQLLAGLGASIAVLFASYSRSAYGALAAAVVVIGAVGYGRVSKKVVGLGFLGAIVIIASLGLLSMTDWYSNVILHEDPESTVVSKSNDEHVQSLIDGTERALVQPFGAGVGSTGSATLYDESTSNDRIIENYYLFVAHESGWLGLVVFGLIFGLVLLRLYRRKQSWLALGLFGSGIGLGLIGLLLPVWADETVSLVWWGLAGATIASTSGIIEGSHATRTSKQTTTRTSRVR